MTQTSVLFLPPLLHLPPVPHRQDRTKWPQKEYCGTHCTSRQPNLLKLQIHKQFTVIRTVMAQRKLYSFLFCWSLPFWLKHNSKKYARSLLLINVYSPFQICYFIPVLVSHKYRSLFSGQHINPSDIKKEEQNDLTAAVTFTDLRHV